MKANEFIKKYGLDEAKVFVSSVIDHLSMGDDFNVQELKRLIESHELVGSFGGLEHAKRFLAENIPCADSGALRKAIADVESCQ